MTSEREALTIVCPECDVSPGIMCVVLTGDGLGRTAKRPHNARLREHFWRNLPPRAEVLVWSKPRIWYKPSRSRCGFYVVHPADFGPGYVARTLVSDDRQGWTTIGFFETAEAAQEACAVHNDRERAR